MTALLITLVSSYRSQLLIDAYFKFLSINFTVNVIDTNIKILFFYGTDCYRTILLSSSGPSIYGRCFKISVAGIPTFIAMCALFFGKYLMALGTFVLQTILGGVM